MKCSKCNREELAQRVFNTLKTFRKKMTPRDEICNLTIGQIEILHFIKSKKQVLMKDVADYLEITPPSATSLINNLVVSDIVERKFDQFDRRIILLSITEKGKKIFERAKKEQLIALEKIFCNLNEQEKNTLLILLKKVQGEN